MLPLWAQSPSQPIRIHPTSVEVKYCTDGIEARRCAEIGGKKTVEIVFNLQYTNDSSTTFLVPAPPFAWVSSCQLFRGTGAQVEAQFSLPKPRDLQIEGFLSPPATRFFSVLPPGGTVRSTAKVTLALGATPKQRGVQPGTDHYIEIEIDHWAPRESAEPFRRQWAYLGTLLTGRLPVAPTVKVHVDEKPVCGPCWWQVDGGGGLRAKVDAPHRVR